MCVLLVNISLIEETVRVVNMCVQLVNISLIVIDTIACRQNVRDVCNLIVIVWKTVLAESMCEILQNNSLYVME